MAWGSSWEDSWGHSWGAAHVAVRDLPAIDQDIDILENRADGVDTTLSDMLARLGVVEEHVAHDSPHAGHEQVTNRSNLIGYALTDEHGYLPVPYMTRTGSRETFRGLHLHTSVSNAGGTEIELDKCDHVVLDSGRVLKNIPKLNYSVAAGGAGGRDTSVGATSLWHRLYLIYNALTDSTALYSSTDRVVAGDQSYNTGENTTYWLNQATGNAQYGIGQSFTPAVSGYLSHLDLKLIRRGTIDSDVESFYALIWDVASGVPDQPNNSIGTTYQYNANRVPTSSTLCRLKMRDRVYLTSGTQYCILIWFPSFRTSDTKNLGVRYDATAAGYTGGMRLWSNDLATWTTVSGDDLIFKTWMETTDDSDPMLPTGYTEKALLSRIYLDANGLPKSFRQIDRQVFCTARVAGEQGGSASWKVGLLPSALTYQDLSAFVPPVPTAVTFGLNETAGAGTANYIGLGDYKAYDQVIGNVALSNETLQWKGPGGAQTSGSLLMTNGGPGMVLPIDLQSLLTLCTDTNSTELEVLGFTV